MPDEGLNRRPVNETMILAAATEQLAAQTSRPRVDSGDDPAAVLDAQFDVVRDHEAARVDTDQPASEHIVAEQHLALAAFEVREVEIFSSELDVAGSHHGDAVARNEQLSAGNARDETGDRRITPLREAGDDVVDTAEPAAPRIDEGAVDDPGERQPIRSGGWLPGV